MNQSEPTMPYVYQPEPMNSPLAPRLWSVAGPGAEGFSGIRLEQKHAHELVALLKLYAVYERAFFEKEQSNG